MTDLRTDRNVRVRDQVSLTGFSPYTARRYRLRGLFAARGTRPRIRAARFTRARQQAAATARVRVTAICTGHADRSDRRVWLGPDATRQLLVNAEWLSCAHLESGAAMRKPSTSQSALRLPVPRPASGRPGCSRHPPNRRPSCSCSRPRAATGLSHATCKLQAHMV
jgi:hypothetical protein